MVLAPIKTLPFTAEAAVEAGRLRGYLQKHGIPIGAYDLLIAAQGLSHNLTVVTHNTREFGRVRGLSVEDWVG